MQNIAGYLFVHFTGESPIGEQIYFSLSKDGLHWKDCTDGTPVLTSTLGELGARDPFLIREEHDTRYHLIATDLRIASGKGWDVACNSGSRDLLHWTSTDLIHWSKEESFTLAIPGAGCLWAPECIYDKEHDDYFIFFASNVQEEKEVARKQRIYCTHTKDFKTFTPVQKYIEKENHVIDTTIIFWDKNYYRFSKNETSKHVELDYAPSLEGSEFTPIHSDALASLMGVEGPEIFPLDQNGKFCLIVDRFMEGKGYLPLITQDLSSGQFRILDDSEFDLGKNLKRHGGILPLTDDEFTNLCTHYGISF